MAMPATAVRQALTPAPSIIALFLRPPVFVSEESNLDLRGATKVAFSFHASSKLARSVLMLEYSDQHL